MQIYSATENDFDEKLLALSAEIDRFEGYQHAHGLQVALIADAIGKSFNIASQDRFFMQQAALLHDIGEKTMNRGYIRESRILRPDERLDLQRHPVIGEQDISKLGLTRGVQLLVRWHHEWWNGSGYPDGLEGTNIPLAARILRVADTFSALTSERPRHKANSIKSAREYLAEWAGLEFDPKIVKTFFALDEEKYLEGEISQAINE